MKQDILYKANLISHFCAGHWIQKETESLEEKIKEEKKEDLYVNFNRQNLQN